MLGPSSTLPEGLYHLCPACQGYGVQVVFNEGAISPCEECEGHGVLPHRCSESDNA